MLIELNMLIERLNYDFLKTIKNVVFIYERCCTPSLETSMLSFILSREFYYAGFYLENVIMQHENSFENLHLLHRDLLKFISHTIYLSISGL
jgi:hypothetical protein